MTDEEFYMHFCWFLNNDNYGEGEKHKQIMKLITRFRIENQKLGRVLETNILICSKHSDARFLDFLRSKVPCSLCREEKITSLENALREIANQSTPSVCRMLARKSLNQLDTLSTSESRNRTSEYLIEEKRTLRAKGEK